MTEDHAIPKLLDALAQAVASGGFIKFTISKPTSTAGDLKSIAIRPILVKRALKLSFTYHHATRDVVKNFTPAEAPALIAMQLAEHFRSAYLSATAGDMQLSHVVGHYQLKRHAATKTDAVPLAHDRTKKRWVESSDKPYLHALGITDAKGTVYKTAQDKFRQINKYVEILDGLMGDLPPRETLRMVDMGAGKGYLTFALYDYLMHTLKRKTDMVGVEFRAELVNQGNDIAKAAQFKGLNFVEGSIAGYDCAGADVVIALHACDTATDDAIAKAVKAGAALIVVAPCCHKQIRRAMGKLAGEHALAPMLKHGTYVERMAEMLTDTLRAELMTLQGYRCKLFEFIADAHTPKNVMIVAQKTSAPTMQEAKNIRARIAQLKSEFGIAQHYLERALAE